MSINLQVIYVIYEHAIWFALADWNFSFLPSAWPLVFVTRRSKVHTENLYTETVFEEPQLQHHVYRNGTFVILFESFFFVCACSFFVERWWRVMCDSLVKRCLWAFCVTLRCKKAFHKTCFRRARGLILFGTGDMRLANGHDIPDSSQSILRV